MSAVTDHAVDHGHDDDHGEHLSDLGYVKIAGLLAVLTAIEVLTFPLEDSIPRAGMFIILTVLMIIKFAMVAAYFMHLKYDTDWFWKVFVAGIVLAISVYAIFFFSFDLFGDPIEFDPK